MCLKKLSAVLGFLGPLNSSPLKEHVLWEMLSQVTRDVFYIVLLTLH